MMEKGEHAPTDILLPEHIPQIEHDFLHIDGQDREMIREYFDYIQSRLDNPHHYMDQGGAGYVYSINDTICIKMIRDRHRYEHELADSANGVHPHFRLGNDAATEARIQDEIASLQWRGVRAPRMDQFLQGDRWHGLVMEKMNAVNLRKCLNGTEAFPDEFEPEHFLDHLGEYIQQMHKLHGICHNDLFARNVMIDRETALPYVIDFGLAFHFDPKDTRAPEIDWVRYDEIDAEVIPR